MSSSLLLRRGGAAMLPRASSGSACSAVRAASTTPFNKGPSSVESGPQAQEHRGKTTSYVLPATAGALALGAFAWLLTSQSKPDLVKKGENVTKSDVLDKLEKPKPNMLKTSKGPNDGGDKLQ